MHYNRETRQSHLYPFTNPRIIDGVRERESEKPHENDTTQKSNHFLALESQQMAASKALRGETKKQRRFHILHKNLREKKKKKRCRERERGGEKQTGLYDCDLS